MRKPALVSMSSFIADRRESLARQRKALADVVEHKDDFAPAYAVVNKLAKVADNSGKVYISAEPEVWEHWDNEKTLTLRASITLQNVESLKDGRVPMMIETAESYGFEFNDTRDWASETYAERTYRSEFKLGKVNIKLSLIADIASDAQACKKVQVGTELKSVPKYEIVCE